MGRPAEKRTVDCERVAALSGRLSAISLFDLCQFLMLNRKTGNLTVRSGGSAAYLVFLDGQLLSAADESRRDGEGVVLRAVQWEDGTFEFVPGPVPLDRRIQSSTENILLDAARRIDEMQADAGRSGPSGQGAEAAFLEKQARGASIVEAFRSAVADADRMRSEAGWKGIVLEKLAGPSAERLLLGPGARVAIVTARGCEEISGVAEPVVRSWMDELAPVSAKPGVMGGIALPHPSPQPDGTTLWAVRVQGPDGDWIAASAVRPGFPDWTALGLPEADFAELERQESGVVLVIGDRARGGSASPLRDGLAAWIHRRAVARRECGIVVDHLPRFDWCALPGTWRSISAVWARRPGRLTKLLRASGAQTMIWLGSCPGGALLEALHLASAGFLVVLAEEAMDLDGALARIEGRLALENLPRRLPDFESLTAWQLRSGDSASGLPLQSRIVWPQRAQRKQ